MNYAIGYTLLAKHLFKFFNTKKLKLTAKECEQLIGNRHKEKVAENVFKCAVKLVIDDVINNNITFQLPTNKRKAFIKMKRYDNEAFAKGRRNGKWQDVDFLQSNFSAYQMVFQYMSRGVTLHKPIYLDKKHKDSITKYTNEGKQYY